MAPGPIPAAGDRPAIGRLLPALAALGLAGLLLLALAIGAVVGGLPSLQPTGPDAYRPSDVAVADIPDAYLRLYLAAGRQHRLDWAVLAAIGKIETDHGRSPAPGVRTGVNAAGCCAGPMQFNIRNGPPSTWDAYRTDGNRDGHTDVYDPADAIPAAARYLRASGAPDDYRRAIFAYNHADWYVQEVLEQTERYRGALQDAGPLRDQLEVGRANAAEVLRNPRIRLTPVQRADLHRGTIDARVIGVLGWLGAKHTLVVTALQSDHAPGTNHEAGRAVDVGAIDGQLCNGSRRGACADAVRALARIEGVMRPTELIYAWDPDLQDPRDFADPIGHDDHVHIGWDAKSE